MSAAQASSLQPEAPAAAVEALACVALDDLPFGMLVVDAQGTVLGGNRLAAEWLHRPGAGLAGMPFVSLLDTASAWLWEMFALPRLALTGRLDGVSLNCAATGGEGRPMLLSARPVRPGADAGFRLSLVDGAMQREQTRRGAAAAARANRLARVVENAMEPVVLVDERLRVVAHNHATVTFFGRPGEALMGRGLETFLARGAEESQALAAAIRAHGRGGAPDAEFGFETGSGAVRAAMVKSTALHASAEDEPAFGVFLIDMTERRRLETLRTAMRALEVAERERRDVLSRVSHEFLTPLNAVLGFTRSAMEEGVVVRTPQLLRQLTQAHAAGRQLVTLVDAVLGLTRNDDSSRAGTAQVVLGTLLRRCVAAASAQAARGDVRVQVVCDDAQAEVSLPVFQVERCLANLVSNAIRYNGAGGTVQVHARIRAGRLVLRVVDDGPGLTPGSLQRAFLPFERLDAEDRGIDGAGLGLAVSRAQLVRLGGSLRARSRPHRLTVFTAQLPVQVAAGVAEPVAPTLPDPGLAASGASAASVPVAAPEGPTPQRRFTVVLAEPAPFPRMLVEMAFAEFPDWQLAVAEDEDGLRARCAQHRPDVVLLDDTLARALARALGPDWPRVVRGVPGASGSRWVLVADGDAPSSAVAAAAGFDRLPRPLSIPLLVQRLTAWDRARHQP